MAAVLVATWGTALLSACWTVWIAGTATVKVDLGRWVQTQLVSLPAGESDVRELESAVAGLCYVLAPPLPVVRAALGLPLSGAG